MIYIFEQLPAGATTPPGFTVQKYDLEKRKLDKAIDGVTSFELSANGEKALYRQGFGSWVPVERSRPLDQLRRLFERVGDDDRIDRVDDPPGARLQTAGLGQLQSFLERGFGAFRVMGGAEHFLETIGSREREVMRRLFANHPKPFDVC